MPFPRCLFGPVTGQFANGNLAAFRRAGNCLAFSSDGSTDLTFRPGESWETFAARFPEGWRPDVIALWLPYTVIPDFLWNARIPILGLAADWNLLWHGYRQTLPLCDLVLTDLPGVEVCRRAGIDHVRQANLFGLENGFLEFHWAETSRDIDVLFVGNLEPAVQRERLSWLGRLARLGNRWRVRIASGVFGDDYCRLLARARIVFNRSIRGECNKRVAETLAAGALLFQENDNREVPIYLRAGKEYVAYGGNDLEALLDHYLSHEQERQQLAEAGRQRVPELTFTRLWEQQLARIMAESEQLQQRVKLRLKQPRQPTLSARVWQALGAGRVAEPALTSDLAGSEMNNDRGLIDALHAKDRGMITAATAALPGFEKAWNSGRGQVVAGLNIAEALCALGRKSDALSQVHAVSAQLSQLKALEASNIDAGHFPAEFDLFRVEWERAAWDNIGNPAAEAEGKRQLLFWRLQTLRADLSDELSHFYEAALARPDLPTAKAALGCALGRSNCVEAAVQHLRTAVTANPFDRQAARALGQSLKEAGDLDGLARFVAERRLLSSAAEDAVPSEPWFAGSPATESSVLRPEAKDLASILILCHNEVAYTRLCLESVLRHTRPPYELIIVDNGSTDDTVRYLMELKSRPGPARVEIIHNEVNRGFPAGCNQGLAVAQGRFIVFLNNDTVVTPDWLDGLVRWSLREWPKVGLVGAVTNGAPPPQRVEPGYSDLNGLDAFARRRREEYSEKTQEHPRLSGFCLLTRRDVIERMGGFDERFGIGFFDDDDLCFRAHDLGYRLLIAQDVYIHHFGSRTFANLGVDAQALLQQNFGQFQSKWGTQRTAGYRGPTAGETGTATKLKLAAAVAPSSGPAGSAIARSAIEAEPKVSLCLIVKNEHENLPACLQSCADLADEIVVVDTGSTDDTPAIAAQFGARVIHFPWVDSFAAARNASLEHAHGQWCFWMDADDRLDAENRERLRTVFASLPEDQNVAFVMKCHCLPNPETGTSTVVDHVRLFRRHPEIRWRYRVHEQILPAIRRTGGDIRWTDVIIQHTGYVDVTQRRRKLDRDLRLLHLENSEHPDDPFTLFNLASVLIDLDQLDAALPLLRQSLALSDPKDSIVRKLYALLAYCLHQKGRLDEALDCCRTGRMHYPNDAELLFREGRLRHSQHDLAGAANCFRQLMAGSEAPHFASVDPTLRGAKARHHLAVVLYDQKDYASAENEWRQVVAECPDFLPAVLGQAEIFLVLRRWNELETLTGALMARGQELEAYVLLARADIDRGQFGAARNRLNKVIAVHPKEILPRVILSHAFLKEGKSLEAAERSLLDILVLAPTHDEATHNLEILRRKRGASDAVAQLES